MVPASLAVCADTWWQIFGGFIGRRLHSTSSISRAGALFFLWQTLVKARDAREALPELCIDWRPIFSVLRRRGYEAQDLRCGNPVGTRNVMAASFAIFAQLEPSDDY